MKPTCKSASYMASLVLALAAGSAEAQVRREGPSPQPTDPAAVAGCARPADAKEAKVIDFDQGKGTARLAVSLGPGRFKLVTIKAWDRPDDPRPIIPVIEAARITQGKVQFFTPNLNTDPESAPDSFIIMTDMGGGFVCWATPSSLLKEGAYAVADGGAPENSNSSQNARTPVAARPIVSPEAAPDTATPAAAASSGTDSGTSRTRGRRRL